MDATGVGLSTCLFTATNFKCFTCNLKLSGFMYVLKTGVRLFISSFGGLCCPLMASRIYPLS